MPRRAPTVVALITLFTKADCHLCEDTLRVLEELRVELPFELDVRDITLDDALHRQYFERIPVVCLDGEELFEFFVDAELLSERLQEGGAGGRRLPSRAPRSNPQEGGAGGRRLPSRAPRSNPQEGGAGGRRPPSRAPRPIL
jgi:glutaredoxin